MPTRDDHLKKDGPKRILALDGGGIRGIITLGYLKRIEDLLRARHGGRNDFRLAHYFDLIAGTSTGAIIGAALAKGMSVDEITDYYLRLGSVVFGEKRWFSTILRAKYDKDKLQGLLQDILGTDTTLGSTEIQTGLLVVTKRCDTGSPWPLGNNPDGKYFTAPAGADWHANAEYPLWQVVRASTAAPTYFDPEPISIGQHELGRFVDGGVSPHNNPSLQAFMYATLSGYGINWKTGEDSLLIVSVGTGSAHPGISDAMTAAKDGVNALGGLMTDSAALVETMMQWMSRSPTARRIDGEIGSLSGDLLGGRALFQYLRYNVELTREGLAPYLPNIESDTLETIAEMDEVKNLQTLQEIGQRAAAAQVIPGHFPSGFDIH